MTSILTNTAALSSLQSLTATQSQLSRVQAQISSGLAVANASDNAAYWSIATGMKANVAALAAANEGLSLVGAIASVTSSALTQVVSDLTKMKSDLLSASEAGVDQNAVQSDIAGVQQNIVATLASASFNGVNWLYKTTSDSNYTVSQDEYPSITEDEYDTSFVGGTAHETYIQGNLLTPSGSLSSAFRTETENANAYSTGPGSVTSDGDVVISESEDTNPVYQYVSSASVNTISSDVDTGSMGLLSLNTGRNVYQSQTIFSDQDIQTSYDVTGQYYSGSLGNPIVGLDNTDGSPTSIIDFNVASATPGQIALISDAITGAMANVITVAGLVAGVATQVTTMQSFNSAFSNALTSGVGSLVDADMNVASTRLQALQTQQQLGIQALSIANQNSQMILKLFQAA